MIILGVLLIFIYSFAIEPLKSNAKLMGEPLNILEPFIAIANSGAILLIIPLVFLTLIADFPKIDTNTVFYIMRVGRLNWLFGQLLKLIFMALSYLAVIFLGCSASNAFRRLLVQWLEQRGDKVCFTAFLNIRAISACSFSLKISTISSQYFQPQCKATCSCSHTL